MNYNIECKIADLRNTKGKEDASYFGHVPDHDYTDANLNKIISGISATKQFDTDKIGYMREAMPNEKEMQKIVDDIKNYYINNFEYNMGQSDFNIKVRLFLHAGFKKIEGDACGDEVRISCKNVVNEVDKALDGNNFADKLYNRKITFPTVDTTDYFLVRFIAVLAHELFHVFHRNHYESSNNGANWYESQADKILIEAFAEYFSYSYINYYIEQNTSEENEKNIKRNQVIDCVSAARCFGVGRKKLIRKYSKEEYSQEIIDDENKYNNLLKMESTRNIIAENNGLSTADYAGGYILWYMGKTKNEDMPGMQGKQYKKYDSMYSKMINGDAETALDELIELKEEWSK